MITLLRSRYFRVAGLVGFVLATVAIFAYFIDFGEVLDDLRHANLSILLLSLIPLLLCLTAYAHRWRLLLQKKPGAGYTFHTSNIGHGVNTIIPLRAGEVARIIVMGQHPRLSYTEAISSYFLERTFEQVMRLVALVAAFFVGTRDILTIRSFLGVLTPLVVAFLVLLIIINTQQWLLLHLPPLLARLPYIKETQARSSLSKFLFILNGVSEPRRLFGIFFWTVVTWVFGAAYHYLVAVSMGDVFTREEWLPLTLASLAFSPPSATTQPIIMQGIVATPLGLAGFNYSQVFTYAVLLNVSQLVLMVLLGLLGLTRLGYTFRGLRILLGQQGSETRQMMRQRQSGVEEVSEKSDEPNG